MPLTRQLSLTQQNHEKTPNRLREANPPHAHACSSQAATKQSVRSIGRKDNRGGWAVSRLFNLPSLLVSYKKTLYGFRPWPVHAHSMSLRDSGIFVASFAVTVLAMSITYCANLSSSPSLISSFHPLPAVHTSSPYLATSPFTPSIPPSLPPPPSRRTQAWNILH